MPKRTQCFECGAGLYHRKKYLIIEVIGVASGRRTCQVKQLCEQCYNTKFEVKVAELKIPKPPKTEGFLGEAKG